MPLDRRPFFDAVLAAPADDTPRLVYADWLDEHGDEHDRARAEFIRTQCAVARLPNSDPQKAVLAARANALLDGHGLVWLADFPKTGAFNVFRYAGSGPSRVVGLNPVVFRRGFLSGLQFFVMSFGEEIEPLLAREPVTDVLVEFNLDESPEAEAVAWVERLATNPRLRLVSALHGPDSGLGEERFSILIRSPHLVNLIDVDVFEDQIGVGGLQALAESPTPFVLGRLFLNGVFGLESYEIVEEQPTAVEAARLIARTPRFADLRHLGLYHNGFREQSVRELIASPYLRPEIAFEFDDSGWPEPGSPLSAELTARFPGPPRNRV